MTKNKHNKTLPPITRHISEARDPQTEEQWGWFLAGLIDSDGHFNKLGYLIIAFDLANLSCAYDVKQIIGYGTVAPIKNKRAYTFILSHRKGCTWVAKVTVNKLKHPNKIMQYNTRFVPRLNMAPCTKVSESLEHNHWPFAFAFDTISDPLRKQKQRQK